MRFTPAKTLAVSVCTVALLSAVGCSSDDSTDSSSDNTTKSSTSTDPTETPAPSADPAAADPAADLVGPACAAYAKAVPDGKGSVSGMAEDPVATAASNNPLLTTLVSTVNGTFNKKVNLVDTLNGGEFTVFAPTNDAFAKLDKATLKALAQPKNAALLSQILTYHVVSGQIAPADIDGMHKTVEGKSLKVSGSGDAIKVNGATSVVCGGVHTANATVYLIDSVLLPPDLKM